MIERKDTRTLLRKEESHLKKKELIGKLLKIIDYLWETETTYQEMRSERQLEELKRRLFNSTFQFSSMYRSWIPKPNKPGQLRPITQPNKADILVMDALAQL